jgi:hypothetical protein
MRPPTHSHLGAHREGFVLLRRHPVHVLGLALLAMLLAQLGPALELAAGTGSSLVSRALFGYLGILPLEMYLIPRLQAQLDAEGLNTAENPTGHWQATFEARWLAVLLARLGLSLAFFLGFSLFFVPGIVILTLFGWGPLRILLRGDKLLPGFQWSRTAMARHWPRIVQAVLAMMLIALLYLIGIGWVMSHLFPTLDPDLIPTASLRLKHPAFWILNLTTALLNLWLSCALLALFQRLERVFLQAEA